jgi:AraC family transcriptional regulator
MEPIIQYKPGFTAIGLRYRGKPQGSELPQLWDVFVPRIAEVPNQAHPSESYGVIDNFDPATGAFDYTACTAVTRTDQVPAGMVSTVVPPNRYAIFTCNLQTIQQAFAEAEAWFKTAGYQRKMAPEFELYDAAFNGGESPVYLHIPIE